MVDGICVQWRVCLPSLCASIRLGRLLFSTESSLLSFFLVRLAVTGSRSRHNNDKSAMQCGTKLTEKKHRKFNASVSRISVVRRGQRREV